MNRRHARRRPAAAAILGLLAWAMLAAKAEAGTWKHEVVANDGDVLTYRDGDRTVFYVGCGRGFAIHARYPGEARKDGPATIAIATRKGRRTVRGEFEDPATFGGTDFRQTYLGLLRSDPRVFGKAWNADKAKLIDLLDGGPITISAGRSSYQLPAVDAAAGWRDALKACGN